MATLDHSPAVLRAQKRRALVAALWFNRGELDAEKLRQVLRVLSTDDPPTQPRPA